MRDPYEVLGVSRDAKNEDIKKAYKELAKKYHPDNYVDSPLAEMAEEKMKEINEAYDEILRERTGKNSGSAGKTYSNGSQSSGGYSDNGYHDYDGIRAAINAGDYRGAESMLNRIPQTSRAGEWFFLKGCIFVQRGYYFEAMRYLDRACELDPHNAEYSRLRDNLRVQSQSYGNQSAHRGGGSCDMCDVCTALICLDCLCR